MLIRGFWFTVIVLAMGAVVAVPVIRALVLIDRRGYPPAVFFVWLAGAALYAAVASVAFLWILIHSGVGEWVERG